MTIEKTAKAVPGPQQPEARCFVIGPIGDRQAAFGSEERLQYEQSIQTWDYVIKPACEALGLNPVRADMIAEPGEITEQVCRHLRDDEVVIADVTGGNPNVLYELGLRHTRNILTVQIGEKDRLPFDITVIRTIQFVRTETGLVEARERLQEAIKAGLQRGGRPVTATRVWHEASQGVQELPAEARSNTEREEPGFLEMIAEAEEAAPLLTQVMEELTEVLESLPTLTDQAMDEMERADARGQGTAGRLGVAQRLAERLDEPTSRMEQLAGDFVGHLARMDPCISHLIDQIEANPDLLLTDEHANEFAGTITELAEAAEENLPQVAMLADSTQELGKVSNRLRPVSRRMSTALRRIAGTSETLQEWGRRLDQIRPAAA